MSHLIWGGISFSQINATMDVIGIVNTSNLLLLVLSQEDGMRVRSRMDGRHSRYVGKVVKQLGDSWTGSNGVRLSLIQDLSIPRNGQDTFVFLLDRTLGHHDSAQFVISAAHQFSNVPSDSDLVRSPCVSYSSAVPHLLLLLILITFHHDLLYCSLSFFSHDPHNFPLLSLTLLSQVQGIFSLIHLFFPYYSFP